MRTRIFLYALGLASVGAMAGCSGDAATPTAVTSASSSVAPTSSSAPSPTPTAEPRTVEAAKAAVARLAEIEKRHDGGAAWDMLSASGRAAMSRDDYINVTNGCWSLLTTEQVKSVTLDSGGTTATVTASKAAGNGSGTYTWQMVYEDGHWRHQPSKGAMNWMTLGADKALSLLRGQGLCG